MRPVGASVIPGPPSKFRWFATHCDVNCVVPFGTGPCNGRSTTADASGSPDVSGGGVMGPPEWCYARRSAMLNQFLQEN